MACFGEHGRQKEVNKSDPASHCWLCSYLCLNHPSSGPPVQASALGAAAVSDCRDHKISLVRFASGDLRTSCSNGYPGGLPAGSIRGGHARWTSPRSRTGDRSVGRLAVADAPRSYGCSC